jgi:two-component system nitrogen regulation response regulator NtrX
LAAAANERQEGSKSFFVLMRASTVKPEDVASLLGPHKQEPEEPGSWMGDYREARRIWEREYLTRRLREFGGNVTRTAAAVGLERQSLQEKIKTIGVLRP